MLLGCACKKQRWKLCQWSWSRIVGGVVVFWDGGWFLPSLLSFQILWLVRKTLLGCFQEFTALWIGENSKLFRSWGPSESYGKIHGVIEGISIWSNSWRKKNSCQNFSNHEKILQVYRRAFSGWSPLDRGALSHCIEDWIGDQWKESPFS